MTPKALDAFRQGRINLFECEGCGFQGRVPVQLMYHDMNLKLAVLLVPYETLEDRSVLQMFNLDGSLALSEMELDLTKKTGAEYLAQPHIVLSMGEMLAYVHLRESLWIYHSGRAGQP
ncbi:MAG: hypothetical protein C4331_17430 [Meiothermus sp.]